MEVMIEKCNKNLSNIHGLNTFYSTALIDNRGYFQRLCCQKILSQLDIAESVVQVNLSYTRHLGTIRGMHYQFSPYSEIKIISCLKGKAYDVAIDLRADSPTFMSWYGEVLSAELKNTIVIPKGCAHGFQTMSDDCELIYFHTNFYHKEAEGGISPFDPKIGIAWPLPVTEISERDSNHQFLTNDFIGLMNEL